MNQTRVSVGILLIALMAVSWCSLLGGQAVQSAQLTQAVEQAQSYRDRQLYAMSIQEYGKAIAQAPSKALYRELLDVYQLYYTQTSTSAVMRAYTGALDSACGAYPKEASFWEEYVQLYLDRSDYTNAGRVLQKAKNRGASSQALQEQLAAAYYAFQTGYGAYLQVLPGCWDGYYTVRGDDGWGMVTSKGDTVLSPVYVLMGPVGASGRVLATDAGGDCWLVDSKGMLHAHYERPALQAGCWSEGLVPALLDGGDAWSYLSDDGQVVLSGYQAAGAFYQGQAAVQTDRGWQVIDPSGAPVRDALWEDIRLNSDGAFLQNGRILAKSGGSWRIYSASWKEQEDFSCDDIDVYIDGGIAFCRDGQWGFVDKNGRELIAPAYDRARSFSGGVAAVCKDGLWGFIDGEGRLVVDFQFTDAGYFSKEGSCQVQLEQSGPYRIIRWVVAR